MSGRSAFRGKILSDGVVHSMSEDELSRIKSKELEKDGELARLDELCEKFDMGRFRSKVNEKVVKCMDEFEMSMREFRTKEGQYVEFMGKMVEDHHKNVTANEGQQQDVYSMAMELYKTHLKDIEARDLSTLKR